MRQQIQQKDAVELLRSLPAESVDLIVTDPAYAALEKHRVKPNGKPRGTTTRLSESSNNAWFEIFSDHRYPEFFDACMDVLAPNSHLYVMSAADHDQIDVMVRAARAAGFRFWKSIVWDKMRAGMGYHWRASHEVILFFEKGKRRLNNLGWPDVLKESAMFTTEMTMMTASILKNAVEAYNEVSSAKNTIPDLDTGMMQGLITIHGEADPDAMFAALEAVTKARPGLIEEPGLRGKGLYPTEKPVGLWSRLIANSSDKDELVIDPFMGSGSSGEAAIRLGRRYIGGDTSDVAVNAATARLSRVLIEMSK